MPDTSRRRIKADSTRRFPWLAALAFGALCAVAWHFRPTDLGRWGLYGIASFTYLGVKLVASFTHSTEAGPDEVPPGLRIGAIVPSHNEDVDVLLDCINAIAPQVDRVVVVDDGTRDAVGRAAILDIQKMPNVDVFCFEHNRGKRVGLRIGVQHLMATIQPHLIATVDSDTVALEGAVAASTHELMSDRRLGGTTALVRARNWRTNLLTRLQDVRYANAFLWERAAYSQAGSVLCVCGSYTLWRADVLVDTVQDLTAQRFLNKPCTYGDDRHLTNLALARGWRISLCERAVADTLVPEKFDHFRRQQTRWSKSFFRESLWALRHVKRGWPRFLTAVELSSWLVFTSVLLYSLLIRPIVEHRILFGQIVLWIVVMSWARSVRFFDARPEADRRDLAYSFLVAPLYGFLHAVVLLPLRAWALCNLKDNSWGTRTEVEVGGGLRPDGEGAPRVGPDGTGSRSSSGQPRPGRFRPRRARERTGSVERDP